MDIRCTVCGAPTSNGKCDYCGSVSMVEKTTQKKTSEPTVVVNQNVQIGANNALRHCSPKSKGTALLLCIFLGWCGAHKFYVGKTGMGIVYIFTAGLLCIGWVVDIFLIIAGSFKDANNLCLK
jgi:Predicted membrane protein